MVSSEYSELEFHLRQELKRTLAEAAEDKAELAHPRAVLGHKEPVWGREESWLRQRDMVIMD